MIKTTLGFDFGLKRIGVAVGQVITQTAHALTTLAAQAGEPRWSEIEHLLIKWRPQVLIVGRPIKLDGLPQKITQQAEEFAHKLTEYSKLPVYVQDERLTTKAAREQIFAVRGYRKLQTVAIDSIAAQIILQDWIDIYSKELDSDFS